MTQRKTEFKPSVPVQHVRSPGRGGSAAAGPLSALQRRADESAVAQRLRDVQSLADRTAIQRAAEAVEIEEEEPVQGKLIQAAGLEEEEPLQGKLLQPAAMDEEPLQAKAENANGLPAQLKAGIEALSGVSMDGVQVHRNSAAPAEVGAHAYAQGTDIHLAPGQERHLPHEAWHVVQQAQGRVQPTIQAKGVAINDDRALETEADVMGQKALSTVPAEGARAAAPAQLTVRQRVAVAQRMAKPAVTDGKLANIVNALFKGAPAGGSVIGDGSAFAACSHEVGGGAKVGGRNHEGKIQDIQRGLEKLQSKHNNTSSPVELSDADLAVVATLLTACEQALGGTYTG